MFCKFGDFIDLDPDPDTINQDPHHWQRDIKLLNDKNVLIGTDPGPMLYQRNTVVHLN